jgi:hypothetical protein
MSQDAAACVVNVPAIRLVGATSSSSNGSSSRHEIIVIPVI